MAAAKNPWDHLTPSATKYRHLPRMGPARIEFRRVRAEYRLQQDFEELVKAKKEIDELPPEDAAGARERIAGKSAGVNGTIAFLLSIGCELCELETAGKEG